MGSLSRSLPCLLPLLATLFLPMVSGSAMAQDLLFSAVATAGSLEAPVHHFGCSEGASAGLDALDAPEPPLPPTDYLALAFRVPGPEVPWPNRYRDDIRALDDLADQVEIWELHVETDGIGATARFTVAATGGLPPHMHLRVSGPGVDASLPGSFEVALAGPETVLWLILTSDIPVRTVPLGWGALKRAYSPSF